MTPAQRRGSPALEEAADETHGALLLENKGGVEVTRPTSLGTLREGTRKSMAIWIENKGDVPQTLVSCRLAGWDKAKQFRFQMPDKIPVCPTESVVSAPEKNFSDEDVNSLDSCRKDKTHPMLAGGSVNNEGASADAGVCQGEGGEKEAGVSWEQATQPEPGGLIPPGGKTMLVTTCDAKESDVEGLEPLAHDASGTCLAWTAGGGLEPVGPPGTQAGRCLASQESRPLQGAPPALLLRFRRRAVSRGGRRQ
uniref:Uncharacterized protein n=1 Tax=Sus scrofa TaxID=9823 RepID=A0A8D1TM56_PIG